MITMALHLTPIASRNKPFVYQFLQGQGAVEMKSPCRHIKCSGSMEVSQGERRPANYKPTTWSHDFVMSLNNEYSNKINKEGLKKLEEEIRRLLIDDEGQISHLAQLELIDDIERLGLGYRFQSDIIRVLDRIVSLTKGSDDLMMSSLHATSLRFRLLRNYNYEISPDIFRRFKDHINGDFMVCFEKDMKGLLSLYEASFLAFEGEFILDEAKSFATTHLIKNLESLKDTNLIENVNHTLEFPLYRRVQRLEARWYIDLYKRKKDAYQPLLQLAILDFNVVQSKLQTDLKDTSEWWKNINLASKLSFIRDRLMECFIWTIGVVPEPQYSNATIRLTQVGALITTIDDLYDVYGSMDELHLFTYAVQGWDVNAIRDLPNNLKLCFLALYNTVNGMAFDILKEQGVDVKQILIKVWVDLCEAFLVEAKWSADKYMPSLEEYLDNGWRSVSGSLILVHAYFLTNQEITKELLNCLESYHDLLKWSSMIFRLCNDLGTSSAELERGETANSISCYMRDSGVSENIARAHIQTLTDDAWKKLNECRVVDHSPFRKPFIDTATNLARIAECTYKYGDGHGAPDDNAKSRVLMLIIEPITFMESE